jgi:hypothetical protein
MNRFRLSREMRDMCFECECAPAVKGRFYCARCDVPPAVREQDKKLAEEARLYREASHGGSDWGQGEDIPLELTGLDND